MGPTGSGKEIIARIIHDLSGRKGKFVVLNCGAIPEGTLISELFGHERGAFTGAFQTRRGLFEEAHEGSLFLDNVTDLSYTAQSYILRAIETGEILRMGASEPIKVDVRIIASTNKDIWYEIKNKKFREDLFYRIAGSIIKVPGLNERPEDIPDIVKGFLILLHEQYKINMPVVNEATYASMMAKDWPGNVRQLKNIIEQIMFIENPAVITPEIFEKYYYENTPARIHSLAPSFQKQPDEETTSINWNLLIKLLLTLKKDTEEILSLIKEEREERRETAGEVFGVSEHVETDHPLPLPVDERTRIINALRKHYGKRKPAAEELGISTRTLFRLINKYKITDEEVFGKL